MFGTINTTGGPAAAFSNGNAANTVASTNIDLRDNVFELAAAASTSATAPVYGHYATATVYTGSTLNYNDYFVTDAAAAAEAFVGFFNSTADATLANWKTATGQEANSLSSDPKFNNTSDLQPQPTSPVLAAGIPVVGITTDIIGTTRSATTPSMGAYESGADSAPPAIGYTPLGNTSSTASRSLTAVAITDASGVNTTTGTRPRIYYKKASEPNQLASANNSTATGWKNCTSHWGEWFAVLFQH